MRPKTKIQIEVYNQQRELPELTQKQIDFAIKKFFKKRAFATKNKGFCLECGQSIDVAKIVRKRVVCDHCGEKLQVEYTRKKNFSDGPFCFAIASLVKTDKYDFQLVRNFEFRRHYSEGKTARPYVCEVVQNWADISLKEVIFARMICGYNMAFGGDLAIREEGYYKTYRMNPHLWCPSSKFRPEYLKQGMSHKIDIDLSFFRSNVMGSPMAETLIKSGYKEIVFNWNSAAIFKFWPTLKILIRNKYRVKEVSVYKDYLKALEYFNKDLRNPHFVCPPNVHKAHDFWVEKMEAHKVGKELFRKRQEAEKHEQSFRIDKEKFFDLKIKKGPITIEPLRSVKEFVIEGETLKHCVFAGGYYKKKNSLVLSVKVHDKRTETIEFDLKDLKVKQAYGFKNRPSKFHDEIMKVFNRLRPEISKLVIEK